MEFIKRIIPRRFHNSLRIVLKKVQLIKSMFYDYKRYTKSAIAFNNSKTKENLRAEITINYHAIEKGLSNTNVRLGFGKNAIEQLFMNLEEFQKFDSYNTDERYRTGLSALKKYIIYHENNNYDINSLKSRFNSLVMNDNDSELGGIYELNHKEILSKTKEAFDVFANSRASGRCYSKEPVDMRLIEKAIKISMKTPSVCNRQLWKIYIIKNSKLLSNVLEAQKGIRGSGDNLETLLLITADNQYLRDYAERNQGFVDGGMFAMSMLYSLHYVGLATCALNADLTRDSEDYIRKEVNIPDSENLIMFIAVGNYPDTFKVPKSYRDDIKEITRYRI